MQIGDSESGSFMSNIFGAADLSASTIMSPNNYIQLTPGAGTTIEVSGHGLKFGKAGGGSSISFTMKIAANSSWLFYK